MTSALAMSSFTMASAAAPLFSSPAPAPPPSGRSPGGVSSVSSSASSRSVGFVAKANRWHTPGRLTQQQQQNGSGGSTTSHLTGSGSSLSSSGASPRDSTWKSDLRASCIARVKQQRGALLQTLRELPIIKDGGGGVTNGQSSSPSPNSLVASSAAMDAALRTIIEEQLGRRTPSFMPANVEEASACAMSDTVYPASSSSSFSNGASASSSSSASRPFPSRSTGSVLQCSAAVEAAALESDSFTFDGSSSSADECLSSSEYLSLMAQLQEEVLREWEGEREAQEEMEGMEAEIAAFEAQQAEQQAGREVLPCPCCRVGTIYFLSSGAASSSTGVAQGSAAACVVCGMRYPCESLGEFRQQLSEAIDLHAQRCRHAPKFISHPAAASTASAMPSSSTLALACEPCQTWISVPAYATNGWHSMPSSQATEDTDHEMAS